MSLLTIFTLISLVVAAAMTLITLQLVFQERRRSAARVAALEADIYRTADEDLVVLHDPPPPPHHVATPFAAPTRRRTVPIGPLIALGAAIVVGVVVGAVRYRATSDQGRSVSATAPLAHSLELLALDHEQSEDRLTVRGVVRNPPSGSELDHLTAVVLLFNSQGGFLTSARSPIETAALQPGTEAKFSVTVPGATDVGKYRVSFRTDDRVVPHVDRR